MLCYCISHLRQPGSCVFGLTLTTAGASGWKKFPWGFPSMASTLHFLPGLFQCSQHQCCSSNRHKWPRGMGALMSPATTHKWCGTRNWWRNSILGQCPGGQLGEAFLVLLRRSLVGLHPSCPRSDLDNAPYIVILPALSLHCPSVMLLGISSWVN